MSERRSLVGVVDDDDDVRDSLCRLLRLGGFEVQGFPSAADFLERCEQDPPGCLVLDSRMPGMDGVELLRAMNGRGIDSAVVMVTGHGDAETERRARRLGARAFIHKPVKGAALRAAVEGALQAASSGPSRARRRDPGS